MGQWVDINFDCLPLRGVQRLDIPLDASPKYRARCERIKEALEKHGSHNTYYLHNANCVYRLTNQVDLGEIHFRFYGTVLTDEKDMHAKGCDLSVRLLKENCDWLTEPIVQWFAETVSRSVQVEFDRYIAAGDLKQTVARLERLNAQTDESEGFMGMYL